ncbi:hypothetical protein PIB30_017387 [Stylosanthes scabra]|uniref:Transposase-associated domain-containing protein n=1 Tax=Stylosanthes scabra TaxID=79078 RepID=A0ABU6V5U0_9FABA|nr:hypothetical protein [Stylosanthes scabra]
MAAPVPPHRLWMYDRFYTDRGIRPEFMNGVDGFVAHVFTLEEFRVAGVSRCPCSKCCLLNWIGPQEMTLHLYQQVKGDDESPATVDPDIVWRQTLSEPYKNRVYGAGGFFASSLRRSGYAGSSASASSCHTGPPAPKVVDLREQVQNLTQSLQSQGDLLQQQIDEVKSLKSTLAEKDARAEEHLRRMEEMSRMMAAYYGPLRPGTSGGSAAGIDSTTAPPLPPRPPPPPSHPPEGDDDDYDDA